MIEDPAGSPESVTITCPWVHKTVEEMQEEGWGNPWSFRVRDMAHLQMAADKIKLIQSADVRDVILTTPPAQNDLEARDPVGYVMDKFTDEYLQQEAARVA
jgi:hypothetical protein